MRKHLKKVIFLIILLAVIAGIHFSGVAGYLTLENLKENRYLLERTVERHYVPSVVLYILIYIGSSAFAVPDAFILTLAGGLLFHTFPGVIYVGVGATIGAILAFLFSRYLLGNWLQARYAGQLRQFNRELEQNGHLYLLTVRFIPLFPFFLINLLSGLTHIPLRTFVWTTFLGVLPASLIYTYTGSQLGTISSPHDLLSPRLLIAFGLLALLALSPLLWKKLRAMKRA